MTRPASAGWLRLTQYRPPRCSPRTGEPGGVRHAGIGLLQVATEGRLGGCTPADPVARRRCRRRRGGCGVGAVGGWIRARVAATAPAAARGQGHQQCAGQPVTGEMSGRRPSGRRCMRGPSYSLDTHSPGAAAGTAPRPRRIYIAIRARCQCGVPHLRTFRDLAPSGHEAGTRVWRGNALPGFGPQALVNAVKRLRPWGPVRSAHGCARPRVGHGWPTEPAHGSPWPEALTVTLPAPPGPFVICRCQGPRR